LLVFTNMRSVLAWIMGVVWLCACNGDNLGGSCTRHSDCTSGTCSEAGICINPLDASTEIDGSSVPPIPDSAFDAASEVDASPDAPVDAAPDAP